MICAHQHCGQPVHEVYAVHRGDRAFHPRCAYAHPDYRGADGVSGPHLSPGGSPFTTITGPAGVTGGQSA